MALRDLLVYVDESEGALARLRLAADLARRHSSRLTALYVRGGNLAQLHAQSTAEFGLVSSADLNRANQRLLKSIDETAQRLQVALEAIKLKHGIEVELRCLEGVASTVVPQHARFADLCVLSQDVPIDSASIGYTFSEELLFVTGRPVLFVPASGSFETLGQHILIAWNSSRPSARAVNDALAVIERAEQVTVVAINPTEYVGRYGALPPEKLVEHLKLHNPSVQGIWLKNVQTGSIADALQTQAHEVGADLVVAGAFGHPKLWEKLMGGVTRDLLSGMTLPILMSY